MNVLGKDLAIFRYSWGTRLLLVALPVLIAISLAAGAAFFVHSLANQKYIAGEGLVAWVASVLAGFSAVHGLAAWHYYLCTRQVGIDGQCIVNFSFPHRAWRKIEWGMVENIEWRRHYSKYNFVFVSTYSIRGNGTVVKFRSDIIDLSRLIELINYQVVRNGIECVFVDFGVDTRRRIAASMPPCPERTRIMRRGLTTKVSVLNAGGGAN
ncbi:MAG TPA: hypothetical protein VHY79_15575 [Rhizomicrobium sp.]|jgi:hypothetical protein|nr:hypothetical protein [Rhizomicrobium sp.]